MTTPAPAIAPYVPAYASYTPYISVDDYLNEPTGVDTTQLVPGNTDMITQRAALARVIVRASAEADNLCQKCLAATVDVQAGRFRLRPDGTVHVPVDYSPILMITDVQLGTVPGQLTSMTDLSGLWIEEKTVIIPVTGLTVPNANLSAPGYAYAGVGWVYVRMTYVNGWAHGSLKTAAAAGDQLLTPATVLGIVPGLPLTLQDGLKTEAATVASSYVPGATPVPLAGLLLYAHDIGVTVSALPPVIRDATILLTSHKIKTRGAEAVVMGSPGGQGTQTQPIDPGGTTEYTEAKELLKPFRRAR